LSLRHFVRFTSWGRDFPGSPAVGSRFDPWSIKDKKKKSLGRGRAAPDSKVSGQLGGSLQMKSSL